MGLAVNVISLLELRGDGLQFSNYGSPLSLDDQFSMLIITAMLLVDSIIYLLIAWWDVCTHIHIYMGVFVISADTDNVVVYCTVSGLLSLEGILMKLSQVSMEFHGSHTSSCSPHIGQENLVYAAKGCVQHFFSLLFVHVQLFSFSLYLLLLWSFHSLREQWLLSQMKM